MVQWSPSRSLLFAMITPGSVKGTSSIKKTLIASRFPFYQYLSFRFHSRAEPAWFFLDSDGFQMILLAWISFMLVLFSHSNDRKSSWDKVNICYPKTNMGCPQLPANRTSAGYVETHLIRNLNILKWCSIILGVWSYLSHKDTLTSVQTLAACSIPCDCTFAWRHQPYPSRRGGSYRRQATHINTGNFYEVHILMMMLPIQCWSRIYTTLVLC